MYVPVNFDLADAHVLRVKSNLIIMFSRYFLFLTCFCFLLASCEETPDPFEVEPGFDYFPLAVGKHIIYQVDSTIYDPTGDTSVYHSTTMMKEEIVDTLRDNAGNLLFKIERYVRMADTLPWQVTKVFTASIQGNQAVVTEDNLRFIKLTFPVRRNNSWNGNIHFNPGLIVTVAGESLEMFKDWSYKIEETGMPATIGGFSFDDVTTVREADSENLIELRRSKAQYARGIGLVYRELWILDTQCIESCEGKAWEDKAEKGFILKQIITEHN